MRDRLGWVLFGEAFAALEEYCNENTDKAAEYTRRVHGIIFEYEDKAGLT